MVVSFTEVPSVLFGRLLGVYACRNVNNGHGAVQGTEAAADVVVEEKQTHGEDAVVEKEDPKQMSEERYQAWLGLRRQFRAEEANKRFLFEEDNRRLRLACKKTSKRLSRGHRHLTASNQPIPVAAAAETVPLADTRAIGTQPEAGNSFATPAGPIDPLLTAYTALVSVYTHLDSIFAYARHLENAGKTSEAIIADIFHRDAMLGWARSAADCFHRIAVLSSISGVLGAPDWSKLPDIDQAHTVGLLGERISRLVEVLRLPTAFPDCPDDYRKAEKIVIEAQIVLADWYGMNLASTTQGQPVSSSDEAAMPTTTPDDVTPVLPTNADIVRLIADRMKQLQAVFDPLVAVFKTMPGYDLESEETWKTMERNERFRLFCTELNKTLQEILDRIFTKDVSGVDVCLLSDQELDDDGLKMSEASTRSDDSRMTVKSLHRYFGQDLRWDKADETDELWPVLSRAHRLLYGGDL